VHLSWRASCIRLVVTYGEALARVDADWDAPPPAEEPRSRPRIAGEGTFGHERDRRLGLRVAANCWALVRGRAQSVYAQAVELSATGAVLKLLGVTHFRFRGGDLFGVDLFVPGADLPVHATMRPARQVGTLMAFEFVEISAVDRLTLAEYLDLLLA
jgi:hypothetical protein